MKKLIPLMLMLVGIAYGQKQSLYSSYPSLVFQDVMNDEYSTRSLGGVPTAITYINGKATFNGTTSNIAYRSVNGVKSVRLKLTLATTTQAVLTLSATHSISVSSGTISATGFSSPTIYVNGAVSSTITTAESEIVITTATAINANTITLGKVSTSYLSGSVNDFNLFTRALSASEIKNLYNGVAHKDLTLTPLINFNSTAGKIIDLRGNTITNTSTTIKRAGSIFSADFNGSTSKLDFGNIDPLTGDITICGWVKARGYGEGGFGYIFANGKVQLLLRSPFRFSFASDGSTNVHSSNNAYSFNQWLFIVITRTSAGIVNLYLGTSKVPPTLTGAENQSSGFPTSGTTNIALGNLSNQTGTTNGLISQLRVYKSILSINQITQIWQSTVNNYVGD